MSSNHFLVKKLQEILRRLQSPSSNSSAFSPGHTVTEIEGNVSGRNETSTDRFNSTNGSLTNSTHNYESLVERTVTSVGKNLSSGVSVDKLNNTFMLSTNGDSSNVTGNTTFVYGHSVIFSHQDGQREGGNGSKIFGIELTTEGGRDQFGFHPSKESQNDAFTTNYNDDGLMKNLQDIIQVLKMSLGSPKSSDLLPTGSKTGDGGGIDTAGSFSVGHGRDMSLNLTLEDITDLNNLMDDQNSSMPFKHICIIFTYFFIACISIIGNLLVVQLVIRSRRLHTLTHALLGNLGVADLFMATLNIPFSAARVILVEWPFGSLLCRLVPWVQVTSVYVTSITMAVIALDRYQVIMNPLGRRMKNSQGMFLIVAIWSLSAFLSLPYALYHKVVTVLTVRVVNRCQADFTSLVARRWLTVATVLGQYFAPLIFTTVSYVSIMMRLRLRSSGLGSTTPRQMAAQSRAKRKTIKMLVLTVIFFSVCWAPINAYHLLTHFYLVPHNSTAILICHLIAMSSTCYNPFIYCWLNEHFRLEALKWLRCFRTRRSPLVHPGRDHATQPPENQQQFPMQEIRRSENCQSNSMDTSRRCGLVVDYGVPSTEATLGGNLTTHSPGDCPTSTVNEKLLRTRVTEIPTQKRKCTTTRGKQRTGGKGFHSDGSDSGSVGTDPFCGNANSQGSEPTSQCLCKCIGTQESADCMV